MRNHDNNTMMLILSPYGIIIDTTPSRKLWHGQPLMRFVHTDDLIRLCSSLTTHLNTPYRWYELIVIQSEPHLQIVIQPTTNKTHNNNNNNNSLLLSDDNEKQSWIHHAVENGVTMMAHALVVLVQLLQDHAGYKLKNVPYELTDKMLQMLAWTGLIKDMGFAKTIVDRLLDQCMTHITLYLDQALEHSNTSSSLCKPTLV
ncbi:hypothetical protein BDC45DRAFT_552347 [Circinella umbellata]|nr:hypothetical protein BDC45DRAFT_552347 [Circinella umbellata]